MYVVYILSKYIDYSMNLKNKVYFINKMRGYIMYDKLIRFFRLNYNLSQSILSDS